MPALTDAEAERLLEERLVTLLQLSTAVPAGTHELRPGDARIRAAVHEVLRPMIEEIGPDEVRQHPDGDLVARFGPPRDDGLLIQTYIVSQHGNLMDDPLGARITDGGPYGRSGPVAVGQGANQNKGPMAAALTALALRPERLTRPVSLAVNTEGKSSHDGSRRVYDDLATRAAAAILAFSTDLKVSLGNRGRVDVRVTIPGESCHSSQPALGVNPVDRSADVVTALRSSPAPEPHPELGGVTLTPYQLAFEPIAPHTIPAVGRLLADRRLLPGEEPAAVVADVAAHLERSLDFGVAVDEGETMLPAAVPADHPVVAALLRGLERRNRHAGTMFSRNTFDAGYGCAIGTPTVMFGPGRRSFGRDLVAAEFVALADCHDAAHVLAGVVGDLCA